MSIFIDTAGDGTVPFEVRTPRTVQTTDVDGNPQSEIVYDPFDVETVAVSVTYAPDGVTITNKDAIYTLLQQHLAKTLNQFVLTVDNAITDEAALELAADFSTRDVDNYANKKDQLDYIYHVYMLCFYMMVASRNLSPEQYSAGPTPPGKLIDDTLLYGYRLDWTLSEFREGYDLTMPISIRSEMVARGQLGNYPADWIDVCSNTVNLLIVSAYYAEMLSTRINEHLDYPFVFTVS